MSESQSLLEYVLTVSQHMAETNDLDTLLAYVMAEVIQLIGAKHGHVVLVTEQGQLDYAKSYSRADVLPSEDGVSNSILQYVIRAKESLVLGNAMMDPRFGQAKSVVSHRLRSVMCVPLITQERIIGAIYLENRSIKARFRPQNLAPLELFANQAAVSIANARLYQTLEQRVVERTQALAQSNEELAVAKAQAEAASQAKSVFLANMNHELRTPLNGILGYAQILQVDSNLTDRQRDGLATIYTNGKHLLTLIDDLLDLTRIESGRMVLRTGELALQPFLQGVADVIQMSAQEKEVDFIVDFDGKLPAFILTDEKRLRQVLFNLLGNAVKYTHDGHIVFRVQLIEALADGAKQMIQFSAEDSGIGIPADKIETIFQPFEQAGGTEAHEQGTGLGLAISQQIVTLMGSQIQVKSALGQGSHFWFNVTLPTAIQHKVPMGDVETHHTNKDTQTLMARTNPPPTTILHTIYELAQVGDIQRIQEIAQEISDESPIFAKKLLQLANEFNIRKIRQLIKLFLPSE